MNLDGNHQESLLFEGGQADNGPSNEINDSRKIMIDQSDRAKQDEYSRGFKNNSIRTSKYSVITFIPLNLYTQLGKAQNVYFLLIAYM